MNTKSILTHVIAAAALLSMVPSTSAVPVPSKPSTLSTTLVYPNGKPATDAVLVFDLVNNKTNALTTKTYKPDSTGLVTLTLDNSMFMTSTPVIYISSPTGIGFLHWSNSSSPANSTLEPYTSVRVHVLDSAGKPIAHVSVAPAMFQMDRVYGRWSKLVANGWSQTTDAEGYATFSKLPQSFKLQLDVDNPNFAPLNPSSDIQLSNAATTPDATVQLHPGASITGTVVYGPTNAPVAGANVSVSSADNTSGSSTTTSSTGTYTLTRLNPGTYGVVVAQLDSSLKDWVSARKTVQLSSGQRSTGVTITLIHGGIVTGKVIDKTTGKGVPNIMVMAYDPGSRTSNSGTSNADGVYTFHIAPGSYNLNLNGQMSVDQDEQYRTFQIQDEETQTYDFHVNAPSIVHGVVLGPDGKPVAGADVTTTDAEGSRQKPKTDVQGRFTFNSPGIARNSNILARSGNLATAAPFVYVGDDNITLHLTANALISVNGQVTDKSGQPIPNVKLNLILWGTNQGTYVDKATSDAQGHYTFPSAYGNSRYSVDAKIDGYTTPNTLNIQTATSQTLVIPTVIMTASTGFVGGTLFDAKSNPIAGATISDNYNPDNKTTTDTAGHFMLKGLEAPQNGMNIVLTVQTTDGRTDYPQLSSGKSNVTIYMPSPVNGIVLGPDNKPVAGAKVDANVGTMGVQTFITDASGQFSIDSPGLKPKTALMARTSTMATAAPVIYNGEDTVIIHLTPSSLCTITGKVVDSDGNPVPNAKVELYREADDVGGNLAAVQTDTNGQYTFAPVYAQSRYSISVSKKGYGSTSTDETTPTPTLQVAQLTLPIADAIAGGTVVDYKGTPVPGATITDQDINSITATTDQSGHFTLQNVPRGKTNVYAQAPDGTGGGKDLISGRGDNIVYLDKQQGVK